MYACLIQVKCMPNSFGVEVVVHLKYIVNRVPTKEMWELTHIKKWSGKKPTIGHPRQLGILVRVHIIDDKKKKIDSINIVRNCFNWSLNK